MLKGKMVKEIRKYYAEVVEALDEAEKEYNADRRSNTKRANFRFVAAQEMAISELCGRIGVELVGDDLKPLGK